MTKIEIVRPNSYFEPIEKMSLGIKINNDIFSVF